MFTQISLDDLKQDSGLDTLIHFLDQQLGKDDLTDSLDKFENFWGLSGSRWSKYSWLRCDAKFWQPLYFVIFILCISTETRT